MNLKWSGDSAADSKSFSEGLFRQEKQHLWEEERFKVTPPHLLPARRRERPLFSAQVRMIMRSETDGFSTQKEKVIYITQPEQKKKSGFVQNHRFTGRNWGHAGLKEQPMLCRGVRGADSLKIHLWQRSNKWLCLCSGPVLPPRGHPSSALIELHGPCSLFIILSQSLLGSPHLLLEGGEKKPEGYFTPRGRKNSWGFF